MICLKCNEETNNPKFCSRSCAASYNGSKYPKRKRLSNANCVECKSNLPYSAKKYCSRECQDNNKNRPVIEDWLSGTITGLDSLGLLRKPLKNYLISIRGNKCELCGWAQRNVVTGKVPIVADHIDGNWENNRPENIRLICPNCDSIQPTYKALNKGNGRQWRRKS